MHCQFPNCNESAKNNSKLSFFKFPVQDSSRFQIWCQNLGIEPENISGRHVICQKHFAPKQFNNIQKTRLKKTALPFVAQELRSSVLLRNLNQAYNSQLTASNDPLSGLSSAMTRGNNGSNETVIDSQIESIDCTGDLGEVEDVEIMAMNYDEAINPNSDCEGDVAGNESSQTETEMIVDKPSEQAEQSVVLGRKRTSTEISAPGRLIEVVDIDDNDDDTTHQAQIGFVGSLGINKSFPRWPRSQAKFKPILPKPSSSAFSASSKPKPKIIIITKAQLDRSSTLQQEINNKLKAQKLRSQNRSRSHIQDKLAMIPIVQMTDFHSSPATSPSATPSQDGYESSTSQPSPSYETSSEPSLHPRNSQSSTCTLLTTEQMAQLVMPSQDWSINTYPAQENSPSSHKIFTISETVLNSKCIEIIRKSLTIRANSVITMSALSFQIHPAKRAVSSVEEIQDILNNLADMKLCPGVDSVSNWRCSDRQRHVDNKFRHVDCPLICKINNSQTRIAADKFIESEVYNAKPCAKCLETI